MNCQQVRFSFQKYVSAFSENAPAYLIDLLHLLSILLLAKTGHRDGLAGDDGLLHHPRWL